MKKSPRGKYVKTYRIWVQIEIHDEKTDQYVNADESSERWPKGFDPDQDCILATTDKAEIVRVKNAIKMAFN